LEAHIVEPSDGRQRICAAFFVFGQFDQPFDLPLDGPSGFVQGLPEVFGCDESH
jgi:hypothetical protein